MSDCENRWRRSVVLIVTGLLHGGIIFVLIHAEPAYKSLMTSDSTLTIFLVKPQKVVIASVTPKQSIIERGSVKIQEHSLDSETPLPNVSVPPVDHQTSEHPANIDWTGEAQRSAEAIANRTASGNSDSSAASVGSTPWNAHPGRFESTPEGVKLRILDPCFALLHNWTYDPLLGTKGELQLNCNWKKQPPRGDLFDSIRQPPSNK